MHIPLLLLIPILLATLTHARKDLEDPRLDPKTTAGYAGEPYKAPANPKYDYVEALHKSFLFYHAQRSGKIDVQRLAWRTDSCMNCTGAYGEDLSPGWYEAANTMKWTQPKAWTVTQLAYNIYQYGDAMASVNEKMEALHVLKWGSDYLINAHPQPNVLVGCFGISADETNTDIDFGYFGPPEEYEKYVPKGIQKKAYYVTEKNPSTEMAGQAAAALAATSVVFRPVDPAYADLCLTHARQLRDFADKFRGTFQATELGFINTKKWYPSSKYMDELVWANIWLYVATNETSYLEQAKVLFGTMDEASEYSWDDQGGAAAVMLYKLTGEKIYDDRFRQFFVTLLPGGKVKQTPKGLSFINFWGSLRYAANHAYLALAHADELDSRTGQANAIFTTALRDFAAQQINYMLGDAGRSWVVGFGKDYPLRPYHKSSYNSYIDYPMRGQDQGSVGTDFLKSMKVNTFILYGAVAGGPRNDDTFLDDRSNYEFTEVTQDYNAGFTGALAGLVKYYTDKTGAGTFKPFSDCGLNLGWDHPNADMSRNPKYPAGDCYHTCDECSPQFLDAAVPGRGGTLSSNTTSTAFSNPVKPGTESAGMRTVSEHGLVLTLCLVSVVLAWAE